MLKFIKNLFKSKPAKKPYHPPYPFDELYNTRDYKNQQVEEHIKYKNKQHQKAMQAKIDIEKLRNNGL